MAGRVLYLPAIYGYTILQDMASWPESVSSQQPGSIQFESMGLVQSEAVNLAVVHCQLVILQSLGGVLVYVGDLCGKQCYPVPVIDIPDHATRLESRAVSRKATEFG
jgi:hypothetical protein